MSIIDVLIAAALVGGIGLIIGAALGLAGRVLEVEIDKKEIAIREQLPGNNCGGCGYAGCDALARAIATKDAPVTGCPVGGVDVANAIGEIMGETAEIVKYTAFVKCSGNLDVTEAKFRYVGPMNCKEAAVVSHGNKSCIYGCLGYGSCVTVCEFDAIHVENGVAVVDKDKCVACGKCVSQCPKHLIELVPYESNVRVACSSKDKGKDVKEACKLGCIGCKLCEKVCENDAIHVENNIAHIDYDKCTKCGKCAEKCPAKIIEVQQ